MVRTPEEILKFVRDVLNDDLDHKTQSEKLNSSLLAMLNCGADDKTLVNNITKIAEIALDYFHANLVKELAKALLNVVQSRLISYEEQVTQLRLRLADIYEKEKKFESAAKILMAVPLETGQRTYPAEIKVRTYLRIAQLALEYNAEEAESFVNRASILLNDLSKDDDLVVAFRTLYAKVLDHRKKFIEAAHRYYDLSLLRNTFSTSDKLQALTNAIFCTVLASPGVQRSRMLTVLVKDERCCNLPAYGVLKKMHFERLIGTDEVKTSTLVNIFHFKIQEFEKSLPSHQQISDGDCSLLKRAILEHNFAAVSNIFTNITFYDLALLLGIDFVQAEKMALQLIADGRIGGTMDQIEGLIHFIQLNMEEEDVSPTEEALTEWDLRIAEVCNDVNNVTDLIIQRNDSWVKFKRMS
ncbi:unnamed protein product [Thelazia callipaeda]|uniref:COP9 signalosome complex subunit 4 n=1 Tax=Thelazia callipaeda TaxID=103827 RepID=A0A0N5D6J2_THECL|nr:unnamed protein product [Thelazia callipaeda]